MVISENFKWNFRITWARFTPWLFWAFLAPTLKLTEIPVYQKFRFFLVYVVKIFRLITFFGLELFSIWFVEWWLYTRMNGRSCNFCIYFYQKRKKVIFFQFFFHFSWKTSRWQYFCYLETRSLWFMKWSLLTGYKKWFTCKFPFFHKIFYNYSVFTIYL